MSSGSFNRYFEIITWPNYLSIVGDMGSLTFSRIEDMFNFFRSESANNPRVNPSYWHEKLVSSDHNEPPKEYKPEIFLAIVKKELEAWHFEGGCDNETMMEILETAKYASESEYEARSWLYENDGSPITDAWEYTLEEFTDRYKWQLWAIVHTVIAYDLEKRENK